jgi:hypothetical protein
MAGYAWDSARQTGSRLMKDSRIAARVADLAHAAEQQRQGELDELVGILKNTMLSAMQKKDHFAVLRAADMIARFRNLAPGSARRFAGPDAGFIDSERLPEPIPDPEADPTPEPEASFEPPMPPDLPAPVAPAADPPKPEPEDERDEYTKALYAMTDRIMFCHADLEANHPELVTTLNGTNEAITYYDAENRLLPPEQWPSRAGSGKPLLPPGHPGTPPFPWAVTVPRPECRD